MLDKGISNLFFLKNGAEDSLLFLETPPPMNSSNSQPRAGRAVILRTSHVFPLLSRTVDPDADPDPAFQVNPDPNPIGIQGFDDQH